MPAFSIVSLLPFCECEMPFLALDYPRPILNIDLDQ